MDLRCKQGDIAVVNRNVDTGSPNYGKIVNCLKFVDTQPFTIEKKLWQIDGIIVYEHGEYNYCPDDVLTPLRYNEGEDEMVTIMRNKTLDKPVEETQEKETV